MNREGRRIGGQELAEIRRLGRLLPAVADELARQWVVETELDGVEAMLDAADIGDQAGDVQTRVAALLDEVAALRGARR